MSVNKIEFCQELEGSYLGGRIDDLTVLLSPTFGKTRGFKKDIIPHIKLNNDQFVKVTVTIEVETQRQTQLTRPLKLQKITPALTGSAEVTCCAIYFVISIS
jgi:hypothetical protein